MMKNVLILGASGMIGGLILGYCLADATISKVTSIVRKPSGKQHPKLKEVVYADFTDFSSIRNDLKDQQVCYYCVGVYTGQVDRETFRVITVDYTKALASALRKENETTIFCFLSGGGADRKEKSRLMFAKDKGIAENYLLSLHFAQTYIFRPGYIYPVTPRKEPNLSYRLMRMFYKPVISVLFPWFSVTSEQLAKVMMHAGLNGADIETFENNDIRRYYKQQVHV